MDIAGRLAGVAILPARERPGAESLGISNRLTVRAGSARKKGLEIMDDAETEPDYIVVDGAIIDAAYVKSLGLPVGAVRKFVRRLTASDERILEHLQSLEMSVPATWQFLRRLGKLPPDRGVGKQIEAAVLDSMLRGLAGGGDTSTNGTAGSAKGTDRTQLAKGRGKKPGVNARMLETIQKDIDAAGWSCMTWAKHLHCAKSSVVTTQAWQDLKMGRDRQRAERALDRRRRPRGSDLNRD
jgi:hypothetical protein